MASSCCTCCSGGNASDPKYANLPLICLVPRDEGAKNAAFKGNNSKMPRPASAGASSGGFKLLSEDILRKHFNFPQRALYLDSFKRPLITFPMTQEDSNNFNLARKTKINQQILDGTLDGSEAISAPSVFPYATTEAEKQKASEEDEEIIYILQLPDWEYQCPVHNQTIKAPRFIWHSSKKETAQKSREPKRGGGPLNKPKPWLLSRITDFDLLSQW